MIASISKTKEILNKYGLFAKKKYGQNFLIDPNICDLIAKSACDNDSLCIEVGPGIGSLSEYLCQYSNEVIAYEIDNSLKEVLDNELNKDNFKLIMQDFLQADLSYLKDEKVCFCANLPYYITTAILMKIALADVSWQKITVMMQKEVAERIRAKVNESEYSAFSIIMQDLYDIKTVCNVSSKSYLPAPKVDSIVLQLIPKESKKDKAFYEFVQACFKQRRKTLRNNLLEIISKEEIENIYLELGYKDSVRAQELDIVEFRRLYERVCLCQD